MITTIEGNLLELAEIGKFNAIVHGCNCMWNMGGGIARQIADRYPRAMAVDIMESEKGDETKLGNYTHTVISIQEQKVSFGIINGYTQFEGGADVNYPAIMKVMQRINEDFKGKTIGFPAIGAGIAGGDWELIYLIIENTLTNVNPIYVEYVP